MGRGINADKKGTSRRCRTTIMNKIKFTKEELKWIERTADIESAMAMNRFTNLVQIDIKELDKKDIEMIEKISKELIDLYTFLRELRTKLELWDCRFDIDSEIGVIHDKLLGGKQ